MVKYARCRPLRFLAICLAGFAGDIGATERSITGSILHLGGGTAAVDAPLAIPRFPETEAAVRLDGKLDDGIWTQVPAYDRMTVVRPDQGGTGRYRTQTFIFYTERGMYFGAWNEQPTSSLTPRLAGRDGWGTGDAYQVMIDSSGDGRYGYWFMVVLGGTLADGHLMPERRFSSNWDGPWHGETHETEDGWTVEMFLPWSMIDMPGVDEGERRMGLLVTRDLAATNERWAWPGLSWTQPKFISAFQPMVFKGVAPRQQVGFFPYVSHLGDRARGRDEQQAGIDVFWRPSTAFLLNATINPDFGQVEADDIIVNLSAFETFFAEKRLFFTENQEFFRGSVGGPNLLHTRRIGSSVGSRRGGPDFEPGVFLDPYDVGKPVDLLFAGKGVGQLGNWRWGALGVVEDDTRLSRRDSDGSVNAAGRDFAVLRWQRETTAGGGRRAIGWMGTLVDHPARRAVTHGIDLHHRTTDAKWTWDGQMYLSDVADSTGAGGFGQLAWAPQRGDLHLFRTSYYDAGLDLNDAGFIWRNDYGAISYNFDRRNHGTRRYREVRTLFSIWADFNGSGRRIGSLVDIGRSWSFPDNTQASLRAIYSPGRWDDRNSRGHGDYRVERNGGIQVGWGSDTSKRLYSFASGAARTEPRGGWFFDANVSITWRPVAPVAFSPSVLYVHRDAWVLWQQGRHFESFETEQWSPRLRFDAFFTARQQLRIQAEWTGIKAHGAERLTVAANGNLEPSSRETSRFVISRMTLQIRYRWQIAPLSDLFVVYNRNGALSESTAERSFGKLLVDAFGEPGREALLVKLRYRFGR